MNAADAQSIMTLIIYGMIGITIMTAILVWILKTVLHNIEIKNYVDVFVHYTGKHFMEWEKFSCRKKKVNTDNPTSYSVELYHKKAPRLFPYDEKYAIKRKSDGKSTMNFIEVEGQFYPFLPTVDVKDNDKTVGREIWDKKKIKDLSYMEAQLDFNKWKYIAKQGGVPWLIFMIVAGVIGIGLVIMMAMSKKKEVTGK